MMRSRIRRRNTSKIERGHKFMAEGGSPSDPQLLMTQKMVF